MKLISLILLKNKLFFKEMKFNKKIEKKNSSNPCYFKKKDKSYRKRVKKNVR